MKPFHPADVSFIVKKVLYCSVNPSPEYRKMLLNKRVCCILVDDAAAC